MTTIDTSTTKGKIAVMQAYLRGEKVQFKVDGDDWETLEGVPLWFWGEIDYRIKPKPREIWGNFYDLEWHCHATEADARSWMNVPDWADEVAVKFVEVVEE